MKQLNTNLKMLMIYIGILSTRLISSVAYFECNRDSPIIEFVCFFVVISFIIDIIRLAIRKEFHYVTMSNGYSSFLLILMLLDLLWEANFSSELTQTQVVAFLSCLSFVILNEQIKKVSLQQKEAL